MAEATDIPADPEGFLAWEFEQEERYERLNGVVRMMVGASLGHQALLLNLGTELRQRLRGSGCRTFPDGTRLLTPANDLLYPDTVVSCHQHRGDATHLTDATLVGEVLSSSTAERDRGAKWARYRTLPGLRHYLLLAQDRPYVEAFHWRGEWVFHPHEGPDATIHLATWAIDLPLAALYEDLPGPHNGGA